MCGPLPVRWGNGCKLIIIWNKVCDIDVVKRITDLESEMLKIESTFRENEIRWQTEKDDLLNKISNLEMQAKHVSEILFTVNDLLVLKCR